MRHLGRPSGFSGHYSQGGRFSISLSVLLGVCLSVQPAEARRYDTAAGVEEPVHFADSKLRTCIELHLGRADPTPTEMLALTHLYAAGKDIAELTGLEHAKNLAYLDIGVVFSQAGGVPQTQTNRITDISALSELIALTWLNLSDNRITDISALSGLTGIETLTLYGNQITDITALSDLVRLRRLDLERNQITDVSPLSGLINLAWLDLSNNRLTDIAALSGLIGIETLLLDRTGLESIVALSGLWNLKSLSLSGNQVEDISGLSGLLSLETVILYGNRITAIPALSELPNLKSLALGVSRIVDISGLSGLSSLEAVDLKHNQITAIPALSKLPNLKILDCESNLITDVSGLSGLPALEAVTLRHNRIAAFPALTGPTSLRLLDLRGNQITELPDLSALGNLQMLDLEANRITAIPVMPELPNLKFLSLGDNKIADIYYGFHDVIELNGTYYAWGECNIGYTLICRSINGADDWEAFDCVGGLFSGPLQLPGGEGPTPTGNFFELGYNRGYGKIMVPCDNSAFYLAINTAARPSLPDADLEAAFINPNNWTWHDGTTGLPTTAILREDGHDLRECWLVPNGEAEWTIMYDADYGSDYGDKALGYATLAAPLLYLEVDIDIKPGSDLNPINADSKGVIPVAILTTEDFDASTVDPDSIMIAGRGVAVRGKGSKTMSHLEDVDGDGDMDLLVQVDTYVEDEPWDTGRVDLTGETFDSTPITGHDYVLVLPTEL